MCEGVRRGRVKREREEGIQKGRIRTGIGIEKNHT